MLTNVDAGTQRLLNVAHLRMVFGRLLDELANIYRLFFLVGPPMCRFSIKYRLPTVILIYHNARSRDKPNREQKKNTQPALFERQNGRVSISFSFMSHMIINYCIFNRVFCQLFEKICLIKCQIVHFK